MKTAPTNLLDTLLVFIIFVGFFLCNCQYRPTFYAESPITDPDLFKATLGDRSTLTVDGPQYLHHSVLQLGSQNFPFRKVYHAMGHFKNES